MYGSAARLAAQAAAPPDDRAMRLLRRQPGIDLHCHPGLFVGRGLPDYAGDSGVARTVADMRAGGIGGAFFALVPDLPLLGPGPNGLHATRPFQPGEAWAQYRRQRAALDAVLSELPAGVALDAGDLAAAGESERVAVFIACEGGDCLEGRAERVEALHADGVRAIQLVHYTRNALADLQTEAPAHDGLSPAGREVVREMQRLGMVVDVAHASAATVRDVAELGNGPIVLSHSQLKHGRWQHLRLITAEHARVVAETGGVIGLWPSGFGNDSFGDFVDNTLRLIDVVGIDHVGLGTDMDGNYKPVFSSYRQLPDWTAALLDRGLGEEEVAKVVGGNAARILREIL
jgi:membrane dipeptidase